MLGPVLYLTLSLSTSISLVAWQLWHSLVRQIKTRLNGPFVYHTLDVRKGKRKTRDKASTQKEKAHFTLTSRAPSEPFPHAVKGEPHNP